MTKPKDRWNAKAYESILVRVKRGEKAAITQAAAEKGMSLNAYIIEAIKAYKGTRGNIKP